MSRLLDKLKANENPRGRHVNIPMMSYVDVKEGFNRPASTNLNSATQYSIRVQLGTDVFISDDLMISSREDAIASAVESVKRSIVEEIFGEFREPLEQLHRQILDGDQREAMKTLDVIRQSMFP